jgi:poly-gamma-glutamate capsule biosynthesis protein CapA/YwtB (metallophosphatase superfamily)
VPGAACLRLQELAGEATEYFLWQADAGLSDVVLTHRDDGKGIKVGAWTYVVAAPFFTVDDAVSADDLVATWESGAQGAFANHALLLSPDSYQVFSDWWGTPQDIGVLAVNAEEILGTAQQINAWALLPFDVLTPQWKVLELDGRTPLAKDWSPDDDILTLPLFLTSSTRPETIPLLPRTDVSFTNRNEAEMTRVVMTGVTAMTRATAQLMDTKGVLYPAQDIKHWFSDADFVHISNEVSFKPDCVVEGSGSLSFCSHDDYIALLEEINTNIVELTGNHLEDKGVQWLDHSLEMYRERGWKWFGGGANQAEGEKALTIAHGANNLAFIGCNTVGPFASEDSGGAARCNFEWMTAEIRRLRDQGYLPIVTIQYLEAYEYAPSAPQIRDFRILAEAGAVVVQGSQAHQAQTMEFHGETFVHYGLGNFFFDQMWSDGTRQEFVDRLTFYEGRLLNVDLRTAILEEFGRPRPMTVGDPLPAADRQAFLRMIFSLRP